MNTNLSEKMLLVHCTQASKSGAAKYVSELFRAVRRLDSKAILVCPENFEHRDQHPAESLSAICQMDGRRTVDKLSAMGRQFSAATRNIQKIASENRDRATVVHFNFPGLHFFAFYQFKKLKKSGVLLALTVHDVLPHRWLLPVYLNFLESFFLRGMYKRADLLFVHHESQAEKLISEFDIPKARIAVVHHGVFSLSHEPLPYRDDREFVALCFGAIRENKGILSAIRAVQSLRAEGVPVRLLIAGAVSQGEMIYWSACTEQIRLCSDGIEVHEGYIAESDIKGYFERSNFVLLPYSDFFSQSGVATMALSSGRAIVSTDAGGLDEMLSTGQYGFRIDSSTEGSIKAALRQAVSVGHDRLNQMGKDAFEYFRLNYSWDAAAEIQVSACREVALGS